MVVNDEEKVIGLAEKGVSKTASLIYYSTPQSVVADRNYMSIMGILSTEIIIIISLKPEA